MKRPNPWRGAALWLYMAAWAVWLAGGALVVAGMSLLASGLGGSLAELAAGGMSFVLCLMLAAVAGFGGWLLWGQARRHGWAEYRRDHWREVYRK